MDKIRLNLGAGKDYRPGYINADISPDVGADVVFNMTGGIPYPNNFFCEVLAYNCLTQILLSYDFRLVMNELHRVTKPTGFIEIRVPNAKDICSFQDPMDSRRFTDQTFTYMEYGHRRYETYGRHYGFPPFKVELLEDNGRQMLFKLCPIKN